MPRNDASSARSTTARVIKPMRVLLSSTHSENTAIAVAPSTINWSEFRVPSPTWYTFGGTGPMPGALVASEIGRSPHDVWSMRNLMSSEASAGRASSNPIVPTNRADSGARANRRKTTTSRPSPNSGAMTNTVSTKATPRGMNAPSSK